MCDCVVRSDNEEKTPGRANETREYHAPRSLLAASLKENGNCFTTAEGFFSYHYLKFF